MYIFMIAKVYCIVLTFYMQICVLNLQNILPQCSFAVKRPYICVLNKFVMKSYFGYKKPNYFIWFKYILHIILWLKECINSTVLNHYKLSSHWIIQYYCNFDGKPVRWTRGFVGTEINRLHYHSSVIIIIISGLSRYFYAKLL